MEECGLDMSSSGTPEMSTQKSISQEDQLKARALARRQRIEANAAKRIALVSGENFPASKEILGESKESDESKVATNSFNVMNETHTIEGDAESDSEIQDIPRYQDNLTETTNGLQDFSNFMNINGNMGGLTLSSMFSMALPAWNMMQQMGSAPKKMNPQEHVAFVFNLLSTCCICVFATLYALTQLLHFSSLEIFTVFFTLESIMIAMQSRLGVKVESKMVVKVYLFLLQLWGCRPATLSTVESFLRHFSKIFCDFLIFYSIVLICIHLPNIISESDMTAYPIDHEKMPSS